MRSASCDLAVDDLVLVRRAVLGDEERRRVVVASATRTRVFVRPSGTMSQPMWVFGSPVSTISMSSVPIHGVGPRAGPGAAGASSPRTHERAVVVDAEQVEARRDRLEVAVLHEGHVGEAREVGDDVGGVRARAARGSRNQRFCWPSRRRAASTSAGASDAGVTSYRLRTMPTSAGRRPPCSACAARPWPSSRWCDGDDRLGRVGAAGRVLARRVAEERRAPRLVERRPVLHAVAEPVLRDGGVVGEAVRRVAVAPAAVVLERLRQVPVVERRVGLDAAREQPVDEPVVEGEARLVDRAAAGRHDARPGDREAVRRRARARAMQVEVGLPAVVVVAGDVPSEPSRIAPGVRAERVPDRRPAAVLGARALDLVGRRSRHPRRSRPGSASRWRGRLSSTGRSRFVLRMTGAGSQTRWRVEAPSVSTRHRVDRGASVPGRREAARLSLTGRSPGARDAACGPEPKAPVSGEGRRPGLGALPQCAPRPAPASTTWRCGLAQVSTVSRSVTTSPTSSASRRRTSALSGTM